MNMKKRDFNPFNRIRVDVPNTNSFDLSFDNKLTLDIGKLYPVLVQETLPGDHFKITPQMLVRFAPLVFPIMHRIDATIHFFYVPNRIVWNQFPQFLAGEDYVPPYFQGTTEVPLPVTHLSVWDSLGLPETDNLKMPFSAIPFLAYQRIFNEYYQDQNNDDTYIATRDTLKAIAAMDGLITPVEFGETTWTPLEGHRIRAWEHDYFTSCLPYAQKTETPVSIPLSLGNIPVESAFMELVAGGGDPAAGNVLTDGNGFITDSTPALVKILGTADGSSAEITGTINQLRVAMQLQKFLEKNARGGTRYNELIKVHFGTNIGDDRISRPEYIGGVKNNIIISEVLQTSQTTNDSILGDYAGNATGVIGGNDISYWCPEHGFIIGILSVVPKTAYFQGINKKYSRTSYQDYYWQEFAHLGEQAVLNKELFYSNALPDNTLNGTFGYIPRYSEYKYNASEVHGNFRTDMLDFHLARNFGSLPTLNSDFVYVNDDKRIFAVSASDRNSLYAHIYFDIMAQRKIPFFTDPGGL